MSGDVKHSVSVSMETEEGTSVEPRDNKERPRTDGHGGESGERLYEFTKSSLK